MRFCDYLKYEDGILIWTRLNGSSKKLIGLEAGCVCKKSGYKVMRFNGRTYRIHRVIWEMHNGPIPKGMQIDHINHIRTDNRIENLRLVKSKDNQKNMSTRKDSK